MELGNWLRKLGLEQYETAFRENEIDDSVLPSLTAEDLKDLGVTIVGHRRKLLDAIAALHAPAKAKAAPLAKPPTNDKLATETAERRQLTVMFCDLVGSTALSTRLDPEDMREILRAYHRCCADHIIKAGGFVAKYMGDGVLAYFGYPQAHEDDVERAVRSGLSLIEVVPSLRANDSALQVRVGIATGVVVVGDLIGEGAAQEQGVVGETPNLAARLQSFAEPGQVVISQATRRLAGGLFQYGDLGRVALKGLAEPTQAWQVLGANTVESRFEAQHEATLTPLVGREEELELLLRRWRQAVSGEGQLILLSGEPGIGKSRLTVALQERLQKEPHARLRYFCSPQHTDSAFHPTIAQLERAANFGRHDAPDTKFGKLSSLLGCSDNQHEDVRLLAELLSIPTGNSYSPLDLSPKRKKQKTAEALLRQLETISRQQPVLMIYEDVHWIDPSSRDLLEICLEPLRCMRVLLVVTFRPEFQAPWAGQPHITALSLGRLGRDDGAALVGSVTGALSLPDHIKADIIERTDGIPLFVEELTKAVIEAGESNDGAGAIMSRAPHSVLTVPATLHTSLMARLDRLGSAAKEIAQIGAAVGRDFSYELLARVSQRSDEALSASLTRLTQAGLVFLSGTPPQANLIFKHALVRDIAYGTLLRTERQRLHARILSAIEDQFPDIVATQPELLAQHAADASFSEKAAQYWLEAGQRALARSALREAEAQLRKGLATLSVLADSTDRCSLELDLEIALGKVLMNKNYVADETREAFARARNLAHRLSDTGRLLPILYGQWIVSVQRAEFGTAREIADELLRRACEQRDVLGQMMGHRCLGYVMSRTGEYGRARAQAELACKLYDAAEHRSSHLRYGYDALVLARNNLPQTLNALGYPEQAYEVACRTLRHAHDLGHPASIAMATSVMGSVLAWAHDWRALKQQAEDAIVAATEQGSPFFLLLATNYLGTALAGLARPAEALALLQDAVARFRALGQMNFLPWMLASCAEVHLGLRQGAEGLHLVAEALGTIDRTGEREFELQLLLLRGKLQLTSGNKVDAEDSFELAIDVAQRRDARGYELRASTSLARLWRDQGKRTEARNLLAPIYGWFTEGFDTPDLKEAKALLDELVA